ncbi:MAG: acyl carrier protein [Lachnospiraceae bacterium]|nr:acyl carrier protein [Lachnospiraceae bacterium]
MTEKEKIMIIEESMDLDEGTLSTEDVLDDFDEWDSLAVLSFIALVEERMHKNVDAAELKKVVTVADALTLM